MHIDECYYLGYFQKTIGTKGELALKLDVDSPSAYIDLEGIFVQINKQDKSLVPYFISQCSLNGKVNLRCRLDSVEQLNDAKKLIGKVVFLPLSRLESLENDQFYFHEIINYQAFDKSFGLVGSIKEVLSFNNSNLFSINRDDKEILIPITRQIIERVEKKEKKIYLNCPEGLIDLYLES